MNNFLYLIQQNKLRRVINRKIRKFVNKKYGLTNQKVSIYRGVYSPAE